MISVPGVSVNKTFYLEVFVTLKGQSHKQNQSQRRLGGALL